MFSKGVILLLFVVFKLKFTTSLELSQDDPIEQRVVKMMKESQPDKEPTEPSPESNVMDNWKSAGDGNAELAVVIQEEKQVEIVTLPTYPELDVPNKMGTLPVLCRYQYSTLHWRVTGVKHCLEGQHCCGCRGNKCCRPEQLVPDDDLDDKILGTCEDTFWAWVSGVAIVIMVVVTLQRWAKKCSARSEIHCSAISASLTSKGWEGKNKKLFVLICKKKEDKVELLEDGNMA